MIYRIVMAVLLLLVPAGGVAGEPSRENATIGPPAKSEKEVLRGLQSLWRVQLKIPAATEAFQAEAVKQLREQLPQLDTAGASDDWTLEFVFGRTIMPGAVIRQVGPEPNVEVLACHCRLVRTVVVNERLAKAVAYEGPSFTEPAPIMINGHRFGPAEQSDPEGRQQLLRKAITGFAAEWRQANPNSEQK